MPIRKFILFIALVALVLGLIVLVINYGRALRMIDRKILGLSTQNTKVGQPREVNVNGRVLVKYPVDYTLVLLGDSMTERLGNSDELRAYLKKLYPKNSVEVLNYGFGSTNIMSVQERLEKETFHGRTFRPILDIAFDFILVESFGNNPLSQFPLETGLQKANEALDKAVESIRKANPKAKIIFVATISPNQRLYGQGAVDLEPEKRTQWARERIAYIKNHIDYAKAHNIPLINIFEKSLDGGGDGNLDYISDDDYIHPSPNGVYLISEEIAKFIHEFKLILP